LRYASLSCSKPEPCCVSTVIFCIKEPCKIRDTLPGMLTMFDSFKATSRRFFDALITVVSVLFSAVRWLARSLFGQWQPPRWLQAVGEGLATTGHKARAYPRQAAGAVLALVLLVAAGVYGWHWYSNLPQPHTVGYSLHKPNLTDYTQQPPVVDNLQIRFAES